MIDKDKITLKSKEDQANDRMERLAMSAQGQIKMHVNDTLNPKMDKLLAKNEFEERCEGKIKTWQIFSNKVSSKKNKNFKKGSSVCSCQIRTTESIKKVW